MPRVSFAEMSDPELVERLSEIRRGIFNLRVRNTTKELQNTAQIRADKRELARVMTVMSQRRIAKANAAATEQKN